MRILVTGGFGFIGGHLAQRLYECGHEIIIGSRNPDRKADWATNHVARKTDWDDYDSLTDICENIDAVIHTAGMNAADCIKNPESALEFNGNATGRLVEAAIASCVKKIIYFSTVHVYANPLVGKISERCLPQNDHPYATSHLAGESFVVEAASNNRIEGIVLRPSNIYGAPMDRNVNCWMLLVNDLCRQAVENNTLVLNSDGGQQRDFIGINKVCESVGQLVSLEKAEKNPLILNLTSGKTLSVLEMTKIIQARFDELFGKKPEIIIPQTDNDETKTVPDLVFSQKLFGTYCNVKDINDENDISRLLYFCQEAFNTVSKGNNGFD